MPMPAIKPATTPIPVQLSETEFTEFILPHLSMPKHGPKCKLGYHRVFNLISWVLYTGMQWKCLPVPEDSDGKAEIQYTTVYKVFARWADDGSLERAFVASVGHLAANVIRAMAVTSATVESWRAPSLRGSDMIDLSFHLTDRSNQSCAAYLQAGGGIRRNLHVAATLQCRIGIRVIGSGKNPTRYYSPAVRVAQLGPAIFSISLLEMRL